MRFLKPLADLCLPVITAFAFTACNQFSDNKINMEVAADTAAVADISSSAAIESKDNTRQFIRTADLRFKVKDVIDVTYKIEYLVQQQGGFVTYTNLVTTTDNTTSGQVSEDSLLEKTYSTLSNTVTIRVPNTKLDTTLRCIGFLVQHLDHRLIKADDVSLQILSNKMVLNRHHAYAKSVQSSNQKNNKRLIENVYANDNLLQNQEEADDASINTLSLKDQVQYSTITLDIYQPQVIETKMIAIDKPIPSYEPKFGNRMIVAMQDGWTMVTELMIFLIRFWAVIIFALLLVVLYKKYYNALKTLERK